MKKLSIFFASVLAMLAVSSCEDEKTPVFHQASSDSFEVYEPALQNEYYELTPDGTFDIDCKSAPDYGAPVGPTIYGAIVSLNDKFEETQAITAQNNASRMTFKTSDLAEAICKLKGLTKDNDGYVFTETCQVFIKATCRIDGFPVEGDVDQSYVVSKNYVTLNKVMPYFAIPAPGYIYLVGAPEGWAGPTEGNADHYNDWKLFEKDDAIGSKIYYGTFEIGAGDGAMFRFYTALTGWDADSYGSQVDDNPVAFTLDEAAAGLRMVKGKGAYSFPDWTGGQMSIKVDMSDANNMTVTATPAN